MKAKEYLLQIRKVDRLIENKVAEMEHWKAMAAGTTAYSETVKIGNEMHAVEKVQSSGNRYKMEDAVLKYIEIGNEINSEVDRLVYTRKEVINTIEQLKTDEYDILHKIYVQHKTFQEVAVEKGKSYSWVTSKHGGGLANLQKILDERKEYEQEYFEKGN